MRKSIALLLVAAMLLNFLLFVFGITEPVHFWIVVALVLMALRLAGKP